MRQCKYCGELKEEKEYPNPRTASSHRLILKCKTCTAETDRRYQISNKKEIRRKAKLYQETHREIYRRSAMNQYYKNHAEWRSRNKRWIAKSLSHLCEYRKRRYREPMEMLKVRMRSRIHSALKRRHSRKTNPTMELLGCDRETLFRHIESKFVNGMTWNNRGLWHVDHVRPLASFDLLDPDQLKEAFNYKNLQPLWAADNYRKGSKYEDGTNKISNY